MEKINFKVNGIEIEGTVLHSYLNSNKKDLTIMHYIVYAQNKLLKLQITKYKEIQNTEALVHTLAEYCVIPKLDEGYNKKGELTVNVIDSINSTLYHHSNLECIVILKEEYNKLQKCKAVLEDLKGSIKSLVKSFNL